MDLTDRLIIVTGASSGMGRATAIRLSRLGARIALLGRSTDNLKQTEGQLTGQGHNIYSIDLQNIEGIQSVVESITASQGKVSGLAYCAGVGDSFPVRLAKPNKLIKIMAVNTFAFVEITRVLIKESYRTPACSIVAISSVSSLRGEKGLLGYCMSKSALDSAVRVIAREYATQGVRVNSIIPGWINTPLVEKVIEDYGEQRFIKEMQNRQYVGIGQPEDIADAVAFLLSDSSKLITGTSISVDGGYLS